MYAMLKLTKAQNI